MEKYKEIEGDLLAMASDFDFIGHQCNLYHSFGAGIAKQIKDKFPWAYAADLATPWGDDNKLGTYSIGEAGDDDPVIVNFYCQVGFRSSDGPATAYEYMRGAFRKFNDQFPESTLGLPLIGAGLAGGDWEVIRGIIRRELKDIYVTVVKYK